MIFISWVLVIIVAIVVIQLPALPFRNMLKKSYQEILEAWESLPSPSRFIISIISFMVLACGIMFLYKFHGLFDIIFLSKEEQNLDKEALSNIRRNIWLLGFAIFGGCLAIWARFAHEKQLKYTRKQLEDSAEINRNDRFAKAVELIDNKSGVIATRGGLHVLRDLAYENPEAEYIRCVEIISHWLASYYEESTETYLLDMAIGIFKTKKINKQLERKINNYKYNNNWLYWPNFKGVELVNVNLQNLDLQRANLPNANFNMAYLQDINLQGANLQRARLLQAFLRDVNFMWADLERADLRGARLENINFQGAQLLHADFSDANFNDVNLKDADLTNADMAGAKGLTKEQILSAEWFKIFTGAVPPKLPNNLMEDPDVQDWLNNSIVDRDKNFSQKIKSEEA